MNIKLLLPAPCKNSKTALQKRGFSTFQSDTYVTAKFAINKCSNLIKQLLIFNTLRYTSIALWPFLEINKVISPMFCSESLPNLKTDVVKLFILFSVKDPKQKHVKITKYMMDFDLFICIFLKLNSILFWNNKKPKKFKILKWSLSNTPSILGVNSSNVSLSILIRVSDRVM